MIVHLIDGTYELFRQFHGRRRFEKPGASPMSAAAGVLHSILEMVEKGGTHIGVATDHVIESFRNQLWPGYKTGEGIGRVGAARLINQHGPLEALPPAVLGEQRERGPTESFSEVARQLGDERLLARCREAHAQISTRE